MLKFSCLILAVFIASIGLHNCTSKSEVSRYYADNQAVQESQHVMRQSQDFLKQLQHGYDSLKSRKPDRAQQIIASQIDLRAQIASLTQIIDTLQSRRWDPVDLNERLILLKNETMLLHTLMQHGQGVLHADAPAFGVWTTEEDR